MAHPPNKKLKVELPPADESIAAHVSRTVDLTVLHRTNKKENCSLEEVRAERGQLLAIQAELQQRLEANAADFAGIAKERSMLLALKDAIWTIICSFLSTLDLILRRSNQHKKGNFSLEDGILKTMCAFLSTLDLMLRKSNEQTKENCDLEEVRAGRDQLLTLQTELQQRLSANTAELASISKERSTLLALNDDILKTICAFLSNSDLVALEKASMPLVHSTFLLSQWEGRDTFYGPALRSGIECVGVGVRRFKEASAFALQMENSSRLHYHTRRDFGSYEWPEPNEFYSANDLCRDFKLTRNSSFGGKCLGNKANFIGALPQKEFFVRVSYEEDDGSVSVLMEGFRPPVLPREMQYMNATALGFDPSGTYLNMRFADPKGRIHEKSKIQDVRGCLLEQWPEDVREAFLSRVTVTVLACDKSAGCPLSPRLIVATDSYYDSKYNVGFLRPRGRHGERSEVAENLRDCINVGLFPFPRGGFGLVIKWGEVQYQ